MHCRINFDLRSAGGLRTWRHFLDRAADLVVEHGGSLSGEHGDGQQRAELLPKMYGEELVGAFGEMKRIWDPGNRMNPHKVVDPYPIVSNMKLGSDYSPPEVDTHFAFPEDGGSFAHAALRCVGAGKCRNAASGTMCPSYMATKDEEHTTRGRARILYEMLEGETIERRLPLRGGRAKRSTSASPARAARATARSASTWRPTRPSSSPTTTSGACGRCPPTRWG